MFSAPIGWAIKLRRETRATQADKLAAIKAIRREKIQYRRQITFDAAFQEHAEKYNKTLIYWFCSRAVVFLAGTYLYNL